VSEVKADAFHKAHGHSDLERALAQITHKVGLKGKYRWALALDVSVVKANALHNVQVRKLMQKASYEAGFLIE
jgi:hypothetical protein